MDKKRVIIYARVSTKNQDTKSQLLKLQEYCKNHSYKIVDILEDI
jgi:DNA invertase Pin-like site-specific DNA recombinase